MKILFIHNAYHPEQEKRSAVDQWRLSRVARELKKLCPSWTIDERPTIIPDLIKYKSAKDFTQEEMEQAFADICTYDIVYSAYQSNTAMFTLLQVARDRADTQYVMDVDDDMFAINPDNPVWTKVSDENIFHMQCMIRENAWITTTTEALAERFRERRTGHSKQSVVVMPNYIADDYKHPKIDNGDKLVIGFFGGSSHYGDMHRTGVLEAIERIMHEYKHVHFKSVGMIVDKYIPKGRLIIGEPKRGDGWLKEVYPSLNMDIAIAPLEDNIFNQGKSNIKWQEATRAGSLVVASNIGPYKKLLPDTALRCQNTVDDWYRVLKLAVIDEELRRSTIKLAQAVLESSYRLEDNAYRYKDMFETVVKARTPQRVLQSN